MKTALVTGISGYLGSHISKQLKKNGWKIAVASNSIRETIKISLSSGGVDQFVDYYVSNEDVFNPKPFPEMYWQCMTKMKALPKNTIIIEDSHIGREGAMNSGAHLYPVKDAYDLDENFLHYCDEFTKTSKQKQKSTFSSITKIGFLLQRPASVYLRKWDEHRKSSGFGIGRKHGQQNPTFGHGYGAYYPTNRTHYQGVERLRNCSLGHRRSTGFFEFGAVYFHPI